MSPHGSNDEDRTMSFADVRLAWSGKEDAFHLPSSKLEMVEAGEDSVRVIEGDNLGALSALSRELEGQVMLAYLDPPFFTGRLHEKLERSRDRSTGAIVRSLEPAFDDRWANFGSYLGALGARIRCVRGLLAKEGSMVIHVDTRTSHYVKVLCDEIFGPDAFASEIVWRYRRWPSKTPNFQRMHDVLLRYVRDPSEKPRFVQLYEPLAPSTQKTWGDKKQRAVVGADGRRKRSSLTENASPGAPLGDVWDIGIIAPVARERTGYPTQKPEALLHRLVSACTLKGDIVLDPYAGSGTTLAVAAKLERPVIGVDQSGAGLQVIRERLAKLGRTPRWERVV